MKKLLSCILALLLLAGVMPAASADYYDYEPDGIEFDASEGGLCLYIPEDWVFGSHGFVDLAFSEELGYNSGVYVTMLVYNAMSMDDYDRYGYDEDYCAPLITWVCLKDGFDPNAAINAGLDINLNEAFEICTVGDNLEYTHYVVIGEENLPRGISGVYLDEYISFLNQAGDIIYSSVYMPPVNPYAQAAGNTAAFTSRDLNGNAVDSKDLFAANEITMVNLWATWCPHCVKELPELEQISRRLQKLGCGVIGILTDDDYDEARDIIRDSGVTYPVVVGTPETESIFESNGLPITFFVNRNGEIVGVPVEGAQVDKYEEAVKDLLGEVTARSRNQIADYSDAPVKFKSARQASAQADVYRVICVDESGAPVAGAKVQFCTDDTCMLGETDEDGAAEFDVNPGPGNTVHLLKPPAGYAKDKTEYQAPANFGDVTIILKAA